MCRICHQIHQDEEQKLLCIKILDDDEHAPDTYFDVELYDPTTQDSNVLWPGRGGKTVEERGRIYMLERAENTKKWEKNWRGWTGWDRS